MRQLLALQYNRDNQLPDIQVVDYARDSDRSLRIQHRQHRGRPLNEEASRVLGYLQRLWGFTVRLETIDDSGNVIQFEEVRAD